LLGKGLIFCPKTKSHDKIKLAKDVFKFTWRLRLKEFFADKETDDDTYKDVPLFNKKQSSFIPKAGQDVHSDFI
jgi:hypothetical protein